MAVVAAPPGRSERQHLRGPEPLDFPSHEQVGESAVHLRLRTALFLVLEHELRGRAFVGSDQFVYWDPTDPSACLSPDAFVRLGGPLTLPPSFKVWEHGAPTLAVEIISASDSRDLVWEDKLARYRRCGVAEVVRFDPEDDAASLRIWDLAEGDMVERDLSDTKARFCHTLAAYFVVERDPLLGHALRIAADADGKRPWLTPVEAERTVTQAERLAKEAERAAKEAALAAKEAALARVAELELELSRRS